MSMRIYEIVNITIIVVYVVGDGVLLEVGLGIVAVAVVAVVVVEVMIQGVEVSM